MFSVKLAIVIRRAVNNSNLNFTRVREIRRIVKAFEPLPVQYNTNDNIEPGSSNSEIPAKVYRTQTNPFGNEVETNSKETNILANSNFTNFTNADKASTNPFRNEVDSFPCKTSADISDNLSSDYVDTFNAVDIFENTKSPRSALPSPLERVDPENPPDLVPNFPPTFNLAAYVNKSETLQKLIHLGVDLSRIEKRKGLPQFLLKLDFEKDMKQHLTFLMAIGVPPDQLGMFLTKNPLVFKEDLGDLEVRVNYLEVKKFQAEQIARIVTKNPFWLMFSTKRIDRRLGHFQKNFNLSGDDIRFLTTKQPRLITYNMEHIRQNTFSIREEMGFDGDEIKCLLLSKPKLWMMDPNELVERFDFIHRTMNISHDQIVQCPDILISRLFRIKERHGFLKYLGKAQYDPTKELYVSLKRLVEGTDKEFAINVAKSCMDEYNAFLKSL